MRVISPVVRITFLPAHDTLAVGDAIPAALGALSADGSHPTDLPYAFAFDTAVVRAGHGGGSDLAYVSGQAPGTGTVTVRFRNAPPVTRTFVVVPKP